MQDLSNILSEAKISMDKAVEHLDHEFIKLKAGKASPAILNGIMVDYYGAPTLISAVATIATSDSRTVTVQPWDRKLIGAIERSLMAANIGITPQNDGEVIRLSIPPLTEDRRKELVKKAKASGEEAKVGIRTARHKGLDQIKKAVKDGTPEDLGKRKETELQDLVNKMVDQVEKFLGAKEREIMTV
jgi:ribosome recycling factor